MRTHASLPPRSLIALAAAGAVVAALAACNDGRTSAEITGDVFILDAADVGDGSGFDIGDPDGDDTGDADGDADAADVSDTDGLDGADGDAADVPDGGDGIDAPPACGDGAVDDGEACDDGTANSDTRPDACRTNCTLPSCGDGVIDGGELCDDGNVAGGDSCSAECIPSTADLCVPCSDDTDCGGDDDHCIVLETGSFCGSACEADAECPDFFRCATVDRTGGTVRQCLPVSLSCEPCFDPDEDGFGAGPDCAGIDCDQRDPAIYAGADEVCDGADNDCDGQVDEAGAAGVTPFYADADGDGWGVAGRSNLQCAPDDAFPADVPGDCDDESADVNPDAPELCDGLDNDCDASTADGSQDAQVGTACDGDDVDLCTNGILSCVAGELSCGEVGEPTVDVCDGVDNDCNPATPDGSADPGVGEACDGDDADLCAEGEVVCRGGDLVCGDTTGPNPELCNGIDDDCDGATDEGAGDTWYPDVDGDGWGVEVGSVVACDRPDGAWVVDAGDCAPEDPAIHPDADEVCDDGTDNNCNAQADCADLACAGDAACGALSCLDGRLGSAIGFGVATGSNAAGADSRDGRCNGWGREVEYLWTAPATGTYVLDTTGSSYDTVLSVLETDCEGAELVCNDNASGETSRVTLDAEAGEAFVIVIDARSNAETGTYQLNIAADIAEVCDNRIDDDLDTKVDCSDRDCELFTTCCPSDLFEPNQGTSAAPSTTWDRYTANRTEVLTVSTADLDSFRVPVCFRARVSAVARFDHEDANVDLRLLWPTGTVLTSATSTTDNEELSASIDFPGVDRVFLQAYVTSATPACTEYTIDITVDRSDCL